MEGWLGNSNSTKMKLKNKRKETGKKNWEEERRINLNDVEELDERNEAAEENPFQTDLVLFEDLEKKHQAFSCGNQAQSKPISFLLQRLSFTTSEQEKDEHWEFKTLRNEIASFITGIYGDENEFTH